jgi:hypothetical protein
VVITAVPRLGSLKPNVGFWVNVWTIMALTSGAPIIRRSSSISPEACWSGGRAEGPLVLSPHGRRRELRAHGLVASLADQHGDRDAAHDRDHREDEDPATAHSLPRMPDS